MPPSYVRVRTVEWACRCVDRRTDTHTDTRGHYALRVVYDSREKKKAKKMKNRVSV